MLGRHKSNSSDVKEHATALAQAIVEQAANRAMNGAGKAREVASDAKVRVKKSQKRNQDVVPTVRDVALQAATAALELWQAARERAEELAESAEHALAEPASHAVEQAEKRAREAAAVVAGRADDLTGRAKDVSKLVVDRAEGVTERAKDVGKDVVQRADEAAARAKDVGKDAAHRADEVTDRAKDVSKHAAETTVGTSKDTGAALLWTAAAAAIVFYALLDKDRREQVLRAADTVIHQAREIMRDFQGYDEEFV